MVYVRTYSVGQKQLLENASETLDIYMELQSIKMFIKILMRDAYIDYRYIKGSTTTAR